MHSLFSRQPEEGEPSGMHYVGVVDITWPKSNFEALDNPQRAAIHTLGLRLVELSREADLSRKPRPDKTLLKVARRLITICEGSSVGFEHLNVRLTNMGDGKIFEETFHLETDESQQ